MATLCPQTTRLSLLDEESWQLRESDHQSRTLAWVQEHLLRARRGEKHPIEDFLFTYYPFRAAHLRRWSPGIGVVLQGSSARKFLERKHFTPLPEGVWLSPESLPEHRRHGLLQTLKLLETIHHRPATIGCHGLHEWAMVYQEQKGRHQEVPLRMSPEELAQFVESQSIRCSHYDAFRFFTPSARSLNQLQPEKGRQLEFEQPGCLHANMDLYKWAFKFTPWTPAELLADCFALARRIRKVDMQASPYDLSHYGVEPIRLETLEGKKEYESHQRQFALEANDLRSRLIEIFKGFILPDVLG